MSIESAPDNVYSPPQAEIRDVEADARNSIEFYVVAPYKFFLLYFLTLGLYAYYWVYKHWALYGKRNNLPVLAVIRAIFQIFFFHSLFGKIDARLRKSEQTYHWSPAVIATLVVLLYLASAILGIFSWRGAGFPIADIVNLALLAPTGWLMYLAQKAANTACGDPRGSSNANLTFLNYFWLILGGAFWILTLIGLMLPQEEVA